MENFETLSYCGVYCGACKNYKQNMNCAGCRNEPEMLSDCPTRVCAIERGLLHCGECANFPCEELNGFYHDGKALHAGAYENMREIIEIGADEWLNEQEKKIRQEETIA